jgi:hypothetical protein
MSRSGKIASFGRSCLWGLLILAPAVTQASVIFDWPTNPGWTAGTPTGGQTVTQSFTSVDPNDITVAVNNSGAGPSGMNIAAGYPQISRNPMTGGFPSTNALQLFASSSQSFGTYIETTVSFATPVINLSFQIWDVDALAGQYADKISNIQALAQGGGTVGPDSVTNTNNSINIIIGTGLSTVALGVGSNNNNSNAGTINVTFNGPVTQFSFDWSNNDPALGQQAIALGPLAYTPVPEINFAYPGAGLCGAAILSRSIHRRRRRSTI